MNKALAILFFLSALGGNLLYAWAEEDSALVKRAETLFAEGPSRAEEIVKLLDEELSLRPKNSWARFLRGKVYFFTTRFDKALADFDAAVELLKSFDGSINPNFEMYQAKSLFQLGRCKEAKRILEGRWAFWQNYPKLKKEYEMLYPRVLAMCSDK